jgi:thymidine phosphorylase
MAKEILYSGKAFGKFKEIISAQGGKLIEIIPENIIINCLQKKVQKLKRLIIKK